MITRYKVKATILFTIIMLILLQTISFALTYETTGNNDTRAYSQEIDLGSEIRGKISTTYDVDWYKYYVSSGSSLVVSLINIPIECDYDIRIYNSSNVEIGSGNRSSNSSEFVRVSSSSITYTGYYYIKIYSWKGSSASNEYSLCTLSKDNMTTSNTNTSFSRTNATTYSSNYCKTPNSSSYYTFSLDCTNFASQCIYAGSLPEKLPVSPETRDSNTVWFYDDPPPYTTMPPTSQYSATWTDANFLKRYLTKICDVSGTFYGKAYGWRAYTGQEGNNYFSEVYNYLSTGDIVIWISRDNPTGWHSMVVNKKYTEGGISKIQAANHTGPTGDNFVDLQARLSSNPSSWALLIKIRN